MGDEDQQGREDDDGESPGIAGDDFASRLAFREGGMGVAESPFTGFQQFARGVGAMLGLEHQAKQSRVLEGEPDIGAGQLGQAGLEILPSLPGRSAQNFVEALEAAQSQGIEQRLLVGKVPTGRGVADAEFAAEFPQGDILNAAGHKSSPPPHEARIRGDFRDDRDGERLSIAALYAATIKLQHVSVDNIVPIEYIAAIHLTHHYDEPHQ